MLGIDRWGAAATASSPADPLSVQQAQPTQRMQQGQQAMQAQHTQQGQHAQQTEQAQKAEQADASEPWQWPEAGDAGGDWQFEAQEQLEGHGHGRKPLAKPITGPGLPEDMQVCSGCTFWFDKSAVIKKGEGETEHV